MVSAHAPTPAIHKSVAFSQWNGVCSSQFVKYQWPRPSKVLREQPWKFRACGRLQSVEVTSKWNTPSAVLITMN
jgi:hypothetical protein